MSVSFFDAVPAGAIEVLTDAKGASYFKRADLGRFLDLADIKNNFKNISGKTRYEIC